MGEWVDYNMLALCSAMHHFANSVYSVSGPSPAPLDPRRARGLAHSKYENMARPDKKLPRRVAVIKELFVYPIKACAGISLETSPLGARGLESDRRYALMESVPDGEKGTIVTLRHQPRLVLVTPILRDGTFVS